MLRRERDEDRRGGPADAALARHGQLVQETVARHDGVLVRPRGQADSRFAVFSSSTSAVLAAGDLQRALEREAWPLPRPLRARLAVHTGEADLRDGDDYGTAPSRCARLRALANGGQVLLSSTTAALVRAELPQEITLRDPGVHRLKDLTSSEHIFKLLHPELPSEFPPLRSVDVRPTNLPVQATSFIGREPELAEVKRLIAATRLLTLTGSGGMRQNAFGTSRGG